MSAVLPLAIIYWKQSSAGGSGGFFFVLGAVIWSLLFLGLETAFYPTSLRGTFILYFGFLFNAWTGARLNFMYGGYQLMMTSVITLILFMACFIVASLVPNSNLQNHIKKQAATEKIGIIRLGFLAFLLALIALAWNLKQPLIEEIAPLSGGTLILTLAGIGVGVSTDLYTFVRYSVFIADKNYQESPRYKLAEQWGKFMLPMWFGTLAAAAIAAVISK